MTRRAALRRRLGSILGSVPANTVTPTVSGDLNVGSTLTSTTGVWTNSPTSYSYQWQVEDAQPTTTIPTNVTLPGVVGTAEVGSSLSSTPGTWTENPQSYGYQWQFEETALPQCSLAPGIVGQSVVGSQLQASMGAWSNSPSDYQYQWQYDNGLAPASTFAHNIALGRFSYATTGPVRIAFLGSSTTAGTGASTSANRYVNRFVSELQFRFPGQFSTEAPVIANTTGVWGALSQTYGIHAYNAGISGAKADDYLNNGRLEAVRSLNPIIVFHAIGGNDYGSQVNPVTYRAYIEQAIADIDQGLATKPIHVLIHQHRRLDTFASSYQWSQYGDQLKAIALANPTNVMFIDADDDFNTKQAYSGDPNDVIGTDNIHLTDAGHKLLADVLSQAVRNIVFYDTTQIMENIAAATTLNDLSAAFLPMAQAYQVQLQILQGNGTLTWTEWASVDYDGLEADDFVSVRAAVKIYVQELAKYPTQFIINSGLDDLYMAEVFSSGATVYSGAAPSPDFFFDVSPITDGYLQRHLRRNFHHELAHVLDLETPTAQAVSRSDRWLALNPPGHQYHNGVNPPPYTGEHPPGFMSDYGRTNILEDYAEVYAAMMDPFSYYKIREWVADDPILAAKIELVRENIANTYGPIGNLEFFDRSIVGGNNVDNI